jgi:hypothetical protein
MKKNRLIFYSVFLLFHLGALIFTIALEKNIDLLFTMAGKVPMFKWVALLGLTLLAIDIFWVMRTHRESEKEKDALSHELNTLKAKLFDMQEASRSQRPTSGPGA